MDDMSSIVPWRLYSTYTLNEWSFESSRTRELMRSAEVDGKFPYFGEGRSWDWKEFWTQKHIPGMRRWVLKEEQIPSRL